MYIDSHAHLEGKQFAADRAQVFERARQAGVEAILCIGTGDGPGTGTADCAIKLAEAVAAPRVFATVAIHPHEAGKARDEDFAELERLAEHHKVIAWGEIGLDYFYDHSPRDVQRQVFVRQMRLAEAARKPIIIHCRQSQNSTDAWDDMIATLAEHWSHTQLGGILHCFSGEQRHADAAMEMGFMISFAGNVSFPKAQSIRDVAQAVPLERILIETDSPYLAPVPYRGKRNEPSFVTETARHIGELRDTSGEAIGRATAENFLRFFKLPDSVSS